MVWLKSCPRCKTGDVVLESDMHRWYVQCLQCGYVKHLDDPAVAEAVLRPGRQDREPVSNSA